MNHHNLDILQSHAERQKKKEKLSRKVGGKHQRYFFGGKSKAIKGLRQGQTVYDVTAFIDKNGNCNEPSFNKYRVESRVYNSFEIGCFVKLSYISELFGKRIITSSSLGDCNFSTEINKYSLHRMFTSRRKAERYVKELKKGIHSNKSRKSYEDYYDPCEDDMHKDWHSGE